MSNVEAAELRRYNANSRNNNTGDCTIRALCIAYGQRYDDVHRDLLKIGSEYWYDSIWTKYVRDHGYITKRNVSKDAITLTEFADSHPTGTYLVTVGKRAYGLSSHVVCLENGTIWDTWNSLSWYVNDYWLIRNGEDTIPDSPGFDQDLVDEYVSFLTAYFEKLKKKAPYMDGYVSTSKLQDEYTLLIVARCIPNDTYQEQFADLIEKGMLSQKWVKTLRAIIKFNPKVDFDINKSKTMEKIRVQVREWMYQIRKTIEDTVAVSKATFHPKYYGDMDDRRLLIKLPAWAQPLLTKCVDYGDEAKRWDGDRFEAEMAAFDDDPRKETAPIVYFRADTISELRSDLESYRSKFYRVDYDY